LPKCLKINPSFVRTHRYIDFKTSEKKLEKLLCQKCSVKCFDKEEFDFFVQFHKDYRNDELNALHLLPPIEITENNNEK